MPVLRSDIERALDELISNEQGMKFQGLAVVLAKKRWPDLIACERKSDLGADAISKPSSAPDGIGKVLACSITPTLKKVQDDATKIKAHFEGISKLVFATPVTISNEKGERWVTEIQKDFGYELVIIEREEIITSLMELPNASLLSSHLGLEGNLEPGLAEDIGKVRAAAGEVTELWARRVSKKPLLELRAQRLGKDGRETSDTVSLRDIQDALMQSQRVLLEGPAGRGKTTTLIQLATGQEGLRAIPFLIDLPAWVRSGVDILQYLAGMRSFLSRGVDAEMLARVSNSEHYSFLLNGWNEITDSDSVAAEHSLRGLERDYPAAGIIVATRTHHLNPPLPAVLRGRLRPLTRRERAAYLQARLGSRASELRAQLDADAVLDNITRTPFVLDEVTSLYEAGVTIPSTKLDVIEAVIVALEGSEEHRNHLRQDPLAGCSGQFLAALASHMTQLGTVSIPESVARSMVSAVSGQLKESGQIAFLPAPSSVLASLCAHHVLEREEYPSIAFRYEHQQFQEYYAALGIRRELWDLAGTMSSEHRSEFLKCYVNTPGWAEPLRIIANSISGLAKFAGTGAEAIHVGKVLVEMALTVDPVFAAELAGLCGIQVWQEVRAAIGDRLRVLYGISDGRYRRYALAGMVASGSVDFKDIIEPLLISSDQQERLSTYRTWNEFQTSSLGPQWQEIVSGWEEQARVEFVSELLLQRNASEIAAFAQADPSVQVRKAAVEGLAWIGAEDEVVKFLETMHPDTFDQVVPQLYVEAIPAIMVKRAIASLEKDYSKWSDPFIRLKNLIKQSQLSGTENLELMKEELNRVTGKIDDHFQYFAVKPVLERIRAQSPEWVSFWVAERIVEGSMRFESWKETVFCIPKALEDTLISRLESTDLNEIRGDEITSLLAAGADTDLVERSLSKLLEMRGVILAAPDVAHPLEYAIQRQLEDLLRSVSPDVVLRGLSTWLSESVTRVRVDVISRVFGRIGRTEYDLRRKTDNDLRQNLRLYLKGAVPVVLRDDEAGELKANLGSALSQAGQAEDMMEMRKLIDADIEQIRDWARGRRPMGAMSYSSWYVQAVTVLDPQNAHLVLLELLAEPEYESVAATELVRHIAPPKDNGRFGRKIDYEAIWEARSTGSVKRSDEERRGLSIAALRERIATLTAERASSVKQGGYDRRLRILASALAEIDATGSFEPIFEVLELPSGFESSQVISTFEVLVQNGVTLPTDRTLAIVDSIFRVLQRNGFQQQEFWLAERALCLLPFVDSPKDGIEKISKLISVFRLPHYNLRETVQAIGHSHSDAALPFLCEFANHSSHGKHVTDAWINAVASIDTPDARKLLLSFVDPDEPGLAAGVTVVSNEVLAARLVGLANREKGVKQRLFQLCEVKLTASKRDLLAKAISQLGGVDSVLAGLNLIDDKARDSVPFEIGRQIEAAFVEKRPDRVDQQAYTLAPRSSNEIRERLLKMATNDEQRRKSAISLLAQVEEWRLEYGRPSAEPRHPFLESGEPWPPLEATEHASQTSKSIVRQSLHLPPEFETNTTDR